MQLATHRLDTAKMPHETLSTGEEKFIDTIMRAKEKITHALERLVNTQHIEAATEKIRYLKRAKYIPLIVLGLGATTLPNNDVQGQNNLFTIEAGAVTAYTDTYLEKSHAPNGAYAQLGRDHKGNDSYVGLQTNTQLGYLARQESIDDYIVSQYSTTTLGISAIPYIQLGEYGLNDYREQGGSIQIGLGVGALIAWSQYTHPETPVTLEDQQIAWFLEPQIGYGWYSNGTDKRLLLSAQFLQGQKGDTAIDGNPASNNHDILIKLGCRVGF